MVAEYVTELITCTYGALKKWAPIKKDKIWQQLITVAPSVCNYEQEAVRIFMTVYHERNCEKLCILTLFTKSTSSFFKYSFI